MRSDRDGTCLEKVIDNETVLTSEKTEASPNKESANDMRYDSHNCEVRTYPATPVCLLVSTGIKYRS
jgi:hypothetical protein